MKKSKVFLTTGTLVLAVTALFATKAAKKFNVQIQTGATKGGSPNFVLHNATSNAIPMTTHFTSGLEQIEINANNNTGGRGTAAGNLVTKAGGSSTDVVYYF